MDAQKLKQTVGVDYPATWVQFLDWFNSEQACRQYLEKLRWPDGFVCHKCGVITKVDISSRQIDLPSLSPSSDGHFWHHI